MPFPGESIDFHPLAAQQEQNAAIRNSVDGGAGVVQAAAAQITPSLAPQAVQPEGLPDYLTNPGAFVPPPDERGPGMGLSLADSPDVLPVNPLAPVMQDLHLSAATAPTPIQNPTLTLAQVTQPKNLRRATGAENCGSCKHYSDGKCGTNGGFPVQAHQVSDDYAPAEVKASAAVDEKPHQAAIFQQLDSLYLAEDESPDKGLVWKVICATGTLALSPGPGQTDREVPLHLTDEMFMGVKHAFDESAFPYVTVPETHANGVLENTGYVRQLEVKDATDPSLPEQIKLAYEGAAPGTKLLLAGIDFTEPEVREKALRGSIADTSVGIKFNYRNKRSGKMYPYALEHVALTNIPWVDGLVPFGSTLLSQAPFDADEIDCEFDGVFVTADLSQDTPSTEAVDLPEGSRDGTMGAQFSADATSEEDTETMSKTVTVEQLLAAQKAESEQQAARIQDLESKLALAQGTISSQGQQLHTENVSKRIRELQSAGLPPAVLVRAKQVMLADTSRITGDDGLKLSVSSGEGEDLKTEELQGATGIVEFLLSAMPTTTEDNAATIAATFQGLGELQASQQKEKSASEQVDAWERESHPERFDAEGKRIEAAA